MTDVDLQTQPCTFNASYNFCEVTLPTGGQSNGSFTVNVLDATGPFTVTVMDMSMNVIPGYENLQFATAPFTITGLPAGYYWVGITGASVNNGGKLCFGFVDVDLQTPRTTCNPVQICSYTQGFWGNTGGRNQTHLAKLNAMNLSGIPLVVGGTYTVTISSAASVIGALPGGGPSQALTVSGNLGSSPYNGK
jgi:hypothetical protein